MDIKIGKGMKSNKEYEIKLKEIKNNILYFEFNNEILHVPLYLQYEDQKLNDEIDHIKVNSNPFNEEEYFYTKTKYILLSDIKRIYEYKGQTSKLNIEGTFNIKVNRLTFKPLRQIYSENENLNLGKKIFAGWKVDYSFVDNLAKDDHVYLAIIPSATFQIDEERTIKDIERFSQILKELYDDKSNQIKLQYILNRDVNKIIEMTDDINQVLEQKDVILTLRSIKKDDKLIYYIVPNHSVNSYQNYIIELKNISKNKHKVIEKEVEEKEEKDIKFTSFKERYEKEREVKFNKFARLSKEHEELRRRFREENEDDEEESSRVIFKTRFNKKK